MPARGEAKEDVLGNRLGNDRRGIAAFLVPKLSWGTPLSGQLSCLLCAVKRSFEGKCVDSRPPGRSPSASPSRTPSRGLDSQTEFGNEGTTEASRKQPALAWWKFTSFNNWSRHALVPEALGATQTMAKPNGTRACHLQIMASP